MSFVKNYTPPDFQAKDFVPLISLNFHSYSDKNTNEFVFLEKFTPLAKKFYTVSGSDGSDKSHSWI